MNTKQAGSKEESIELLIKNVNRGQVGEGIYIIICQFEWYDGEIFMLHDQQSYPVHTPFSTLMFIHPHLLPH